MLGPSDRGSDRAVHCSQVEVQLARMFWLESSHLQLEAKIAVQADLVEEQVDDQDIPIPAVFEGGAQLPFSRGQVFHAIQDFDIVAPR